MYNEILQLASYTYHLFKLKTYLTKHTCLFLFKLKFIKLCMCKDLHLLEKANIKHHLHLSSHTTYILQTKPDKLRLTIKTKHKVC